MGTRCSRAMICRSDDEIQKESDSYGVGQKAGLAFTILLTSILLIATLGLIIFWVIMYSGSYVWDDVKRHPNFKNLPIKFNFHPTFMVGGFIFFSGFAMVFYRMITCCRQFIIKLVYTIFQAVGIACVALGFQIIWEAKENSFPLRIPHFYSLHSWLGLATIGMFALQYIVGFCSFLMLFCCSDKETGNCHASHSTFGLITFVLASATVLVGISETAFASFTESQLDQSETSRYKLMEPEVMVINVLGVVIIGAIVLMVWILRGNPRNRSSKGRSASAVSQKL